MPLPRCWTYGTRVDGTPTPSLRGQVSASEKAAAVANWMVVTSSADCSASYRPAGIAPGAYPTVHENSVSTRGLTNHPVYPPSAADELALPQSCPVRAMQAPISPAKAWNLPTVILENVTA